MDRQEFVQWWDDYAGKFPATAMWVQKLGEQAERTLLVTWADALARTPLAAALEVNQLMSLGELEPVGAFDWQREQTAIMVRREASEITYRREKRVTSPGMVDPPTPTGDRGGPSLGERVMTMMSLVKRGVPRDKAMAQAMEGYECPSSDWERTYACPDCLDTGFVTVWHFLSVRAARKDLSLLDHQRYRRSMAVPCHCERGMVHVWQEDGPPPKDWDGWEDRRMVYDPDRFCKFGSTSDPDHLMKFVDWCGEFFQRRVDSSLEGLEEFVR